MSALAHVRSLLIGVNTDAIALAAELLTAARSAADVLAPVADENSPEGIAAGIAFQILADAIAGAVPLDQSQQPAETAEQEQVQR